MRYNQRKARIPLLEKYIVSFSAVHLSVSCFSYFVGKRIQDNRDDDDGDPPINNRNSLPKLSIHEQICVPCTRVTSSGVVCHGLMHKRYRRTNCKRKDNLKSNSSTKQIDGVLPGFELLLRCNKCSTWRSLKKWQEINYIY